MCRQPAVCPAANATLLLSLLLLSLLLLVVKVLLVVLVLLTLLVVLVLPATAAVGTIARHRTRRRSHTYTPCAAPRHR